MSYVITELCTKDGACVEVCPVACIHTKPEASQFYIDPDVCIECEQCEIVCPVDAIFLDIKLPDEYLPSIDVNAAFFRQNKVAVGPVSVDTAFAMIDGAQAHAARTGLAISAVVVDECGAPIAVRRMDQALPRTAELAYAKAYTAATFHITTQELAGQARQPWLRSVLIARKGRILPAGGGVPIIDQTVVVGALGIAGGTTEQDIQCCQAGMAILDEHDH